jgi:hypothetical protein
MADDGVDARYRLILSLRQTKSAAMRGVVRIQALGSDLKLMSGCGAKFLLSEGEG